LGNSPEWNPACGGYVTSCSNSSGSSSGGGLTLTASPPSGPTAEEIAQQERLDRARAEQQEQERIRSIQERERAAEEARAAQRARDEAFDKDHNDCYGPITADTCQAIGM